jgi:phosphohistidine phosphatase
VLGFLRGSPGPGGDRQRAAEDGMRDEVQLYLMRHGDAAPESEDPAQPLSALGRTEVERVGRYLVEIGLHVSQIGHSGKLRARETAELLGERLLGGKAVHQLEGLAPMADPEEARARAESLHEPTLWVGHCPHLDRLASRLLAGEVRCEVVHFETAALACLLRRGTGWRLRWMLTPDLVRGRPPSEGWRR